MISTEDRFRNFNPFAGMFPYEVKKWLDDLFDRIENFPEYYKKYKDKQT